MVWDEELEALATQARHIFGGDAIAEAYVRALSVAPSSVGAAVEVADLIPEQTATVHTKVMDGRETAVAFKAELRRMLTIN